eukprot:TRINITY_DN4689_c0_g1_i3.p1 TRINITY_DN4689_c0_g1~~TRINITY_DN4689_c0_g1_i3.p1  ORF type:complete len:337 (-),score=41.65 TRINITY_DN4689_c0_g1_i3:337-1296(-)
MGVHKVPDSKQEDHSLELFFRENPYFLVPWVCLACVQLAVFQIPCIAAWLDRQGLERFGVFASLHLTVFALIMQFALHGGFAVYHDQLVKRGGKIQDKPYPLQAVETSVRSSMVVIVSMTAYALTPMNQTETSFLEVFAGYSILLIVHDAWFYTVHRIAHTKNLYALIHKTHHKWKQPMVFAAYYIRSPSQILQEHLCIIPCMIFLPVPMYSFMLYQYIGAPMSMLEHCGFHIDHLPLPFLGMVEWPLIGRLTVGHVMTVLGGGWSLVLGSQTIEDHDYHHLNFRGNYGLSYTYLDKLLGTYVETEACKSISDAALLQV